jgi:hypothetical protein
MDTLNIAYSWQFWEGPHGFTTAPCDPAGGNPVWQYGLETSIPYVPPGGSNLWGTVLNGSYPNESGEALVSPPFVIDPDSWLAKILHWFGIETNYDGCNISVNGQVVEPFEGYPAIISTSTSFYAYCVDLEPGWTGHDATEWMVHCFDLSPFMGQTVQMELNFGSDSSVTYDGWYVAGVWIGREEVTPVEGSTWGEIKNLYR